VLLAGFLLIAAWAGLVFPRLTAGQNAIVRMGLATYFSVAILLRRKRETDRALAIPGEATAVAAVAGVAAVVIGQVFGVHQVEWLGVLLVLFACFYWAFPPSYAADILRSLFLLYWAHPLPSQLFGALQTGMQTLSTHGCEWFLHLFNVRVWADGMVLRTGYATFEVPAWCSGMRTATTVFLLGLGLAMLRRFRKIETLLLVPIALAQALALNILRIAVMVAFAPSLGENRMEFLHDSAGVIVLLSAVILYGEISLWERAKRQMKAHRTEPDLEQLRRLKHMPPMWRGAYRLRWWLSVAIAVALIGAGLLYRSRSSHRVDMLRGVVDGLQDTEQFEAAHRAALLVLAMQPHDNDWKLTVIRLMLSRELYEQVLTHLDTVPDGDEYRTTEKNIIRAYALMALERLEEAAVIVRGLPKNMRDRDPRVAMILAQMGYRADDIDEVERSIRTASRWGPNVRRIRHLYPYLRRYRRWQAIADSDRSLPYTNPMQAFAATEAHMNLNNIPNVAALSLNAMRQWPDDPRAIEPLFYMAMKRGDAEWTDRFAAQLIRAVEGADNPDTLAGLTSKCFYLARPDLAWFIYRKIAEIDSAHPFLPLMVARHGAEWFSFRKRWLGMSAPAKTDRFGVESFFVAACLFDTWRPLYDAVPQGRRLATADPVPARQESLQTALTEFAERKEAGTLSLRMRYEYASALEMDGDLAGVEKQLFEIAEAFPDERARIRLVLSEVHERRRNWGKVYETLRGYQNSDNPQLMPMVRLANACARLRLGMASLHIARQCERLFPHSSQAATALASALMQFGTPEEALFALDRPRPRRQREMDILEAEALLRTGRLSELESFCKSVLLPRIPIPPDAMQKPFLPAAELSAVWHRTVAFADSDIAEHTRAAREALASTPSPFLRRMLQQWIDCYEAKCANGTADIEAWTACGRDRIEKATALSQLALLLCWQRRFIEARNAVGVAAKLFPEAPDLWQMLISLSGGDPEVIAQAHRSCPDDPGIWLARLVICTQRSPVAGYGALLVQDDAAEWVASEIARAASEGTFPAGTMTRAGEYLLRGGMTQQASAAAAYAVARSRGLLPAYVLGIRCAIADQDRQRALWCTRQAVRASFRPSPLIYRKLVSLKTVGGEMALDAEMIEALKILRREDPGNPLWAQMLGYVRFRRGGLETIDALRHMTAAIERGATNRTPYIVAAEAARLRGSPKQAADFLRSGLKRYPNDLEMLNNLAYALASSDRGAGEAQQYVPELLEQGADDMRVLDTVAVVYLRSGETAQAEKILARIAETAPSGSRRWFVTKTREAEIAFRREDYAGTVAILHGAFRNAGSVPDDDLLVANELLARAETRRLEQETAQAPEETD